MTQQGHVWVLATGSGDADRGGERADSGLDLAAVLEERRKQRKRKEKSRKGGPRVEMNQRQTAEHQLQSGRSNTERLQCCCAVTFDCANSTEQWFTAEV